MEIELPLGELELAAGAALAILLSLNLTRVAGQKIIFA